MKHKPLTENKELSQFARDYPHKVIEYYKKEDVECAVKWLRKKVRNWDFEGYNESHAFELSMWRYNMMLLINKAFNIEEEENGR